MIGLALAIVRGHASQDVIESAWNMDRIDVPRAPGLGLMLDEVSVFLSAYPRMNLGKVLNSVMERL